MAIFHKIKACFFRESVRQYASQLGDGPLAKQKETIMSNYSDNMVAAMTKKGSFTFAEAEAFASENNLSTRSVVSKIKSLGLAYTPKPKAASQPRFRKADTVAAIAKALNTDSDSIAGLAKADAASLSALLMAID
jgi:hypothetical protein